MSSLPVAPITRPAGKEKSSAPRTWDSERLRLGLQAANGADHGTVNHADRLKSSARLHILPDIEEKLGACDGGLGCLDDGVSCVSSCWC